MRPSKYLPSPAIGTKGSVLQGLFQRRLLRALDPEARLHAPVRTLKDMTEEELQEIERAYGMKVRRPNKGE